ncbi:MAG: hypothetical protein WC373_04970 [Smithella sp.]|jgi:hypothetical protein
MGRLAHDTGNYLYGKGRLYFKADGGSSYIDLGNAPKLEITPEISKVDHFSSRSGTKLKDLSTVTEVKMTCNFDLDEYNADNINIAFLGDGITDSTQAAASVSGAAVTVAADAYLDLASMNISSVKISHGTVTGGAFAVGDVVILGAASGTVQWVGEGFVEVNDVTGTFASTGSLVSGGKSAAVSSAVVQEDIIVTDHATVPTVRYEQGTDYDVDVQAGLFRALSDGDISTTAYVSYDIALVTKEKVQALTETEIAGALLFIGDPDTGPKWRIDMWTVKLSITSAVGFISDDVTPISMTADVLADESGHADSPYFDAVRIG